MPDDVDEAEELAQDSLSDYQKMRVEPQGEKVVRLSLAAAAVMAFAGAVIALKKQQDRSLVGDNEGQAQLIDPVE